MPRPPNLEARENILRSAFELFHERGYKGVSMDDIADKAGIKKPNLFHYYKTKDDLGAAVIELVVGRLKSKVAEELAKIADPIKAVERMFSESTACMEKSGCCRGCFIGNLAQEISDHNEKLRQKISEYLRFWVDHLAAYLDQYREKGYFRKDMNVQQTAEALVALLEGATLMSKANKKADSLKHARVMAVEYLKLVKA